MTEKLNQVSEMGGEIKKAVLCSVYPSRDREEAEISMNELERLLQTAGGECVGILTQEKETPDCKTVIGKGKTEELKTLCENTEAELVVFDCELTPSQIRELEDSIGEKLQVIDRSMLILDIFASHARSAEGCLQVELAQLKYSAPRLTGRGREMSRLGGSVAGSIGSRGPGETKLEIDRRRIRTRISALESELQKVARARNQIRYSRERSGMKRCAIVGYTNAGKSTLLNRLTSAGILAEDKLFATLDTTTRKYTLPGGRDILLTDTVGFIRNLPHHLIKAFRSTLEEAVYSDLLIIVIDSSDPSYESHVQVTEQLLNDLGASGKLRMYVFNKCDVIPNFYDIKGFLTGRTDYSAVAVSAAIGEGIENMIEKLEALLSAGKKKVTFSIPADMGSLVGEIYASGEDVKVEYAEDGVLVEAVVDDKLYGKLKKYIIQE